MVFPLRQHGWAVLLLVPLGGPSLLSAPLFWKVCRLGKRPDLLLQLFLRAPPGSSPSLPLSWQVQPPEAQSCGVLGAGAVLLVLWLPAWSPMGQEGVPGVLLLPGWLM